MLLPLPVKPAGGPCCPPLPRSETTENPSCLASRQAAHNAWAACRAQAEGMQGRRRVQAVCAAGHGDEGPSGSVRKLTRVLSSPACCLQMTVVRVQLSGFHQPEEGPSCVHGWSVVHGWDASQRRCRRRAAAAAAAPAPSTPRLLLLLMWPALHVRIRLAAGQWVDSCAVLALPPCPWLLARARAGMCGWCGPALRGAWGGRRRGWSAAGGQQRHGRKGRKERGGRGGS